MYGTVEFHGVTKNLASVSPSRFIGLKTCALREVWAASGNVALLPVSPKARIGVVTHELLNEAGRGALSADRASIEGKWFEKVRKAEMEMQRSPTEQHLVPVSRSVPDLEVRKIRAVQSALAVAEERSATNRAAGAPGGMHPYGFEIPVKSADGLVRGFIDRVLPTAEGPLIRDYKSGAIFAHADKEDLEPKQEYKVQLKMYAALYAETFNDWPTKIELAPLSGSSISVPFSLEECAGLVREARRLLKDINVAISSKPPEELLGYLGHPDPENCSFCQFRPACPVYRSTTKNVKDGWPVDVLGTVEEVKQLGNSKILLRVEADGAVANIPGLAGASRHPALRTLKQGDSVAIFNLSQSRGNDSYSETQLTTIYNLARDGQVSM